MALFLIDANVLVYAAGSGPHAEACLRVLGAVAEGAAEGRCSPVVLQEVWHLELSGRVAGLDGATDRAYRLLTPLLTVTDEAFRLARGVGSHGLGVMDRLHAGTCLAHGIDTIVTADAAFDDVGGLTRVDPLDAPALARLLP